MLKLKYLVVLLLTTSCYATIKLSQFEKKVFSQHGEDGVIEKIFSLIGTTNRYYVEFGTEDGQECNTRYLREQHGWTGLMMDGGFQNKKINLQQEFITAENINQLFKKYNVPKEFDLLSIDIDFNDFHVWKALDPHYRPRAIVIEYNSSHPPSADKIVVYNPAGKWDRSRYWGASILAMYRLGRQKGYSLVYAESIGINLFFIRDDIIANMSETFENINQPSKIYRHYYRHRRKDRLKRPYIASGIAG